MSGGRLSAGARQGGQERVKAWIMRYICNINNYYLHVHLRARHKPMTGKSGWTRSSNYRENC
jgi:hypothetical protein